MLSARLLPPSAGKSHQRGVAGAAADVIGVELLAGGTNIVDDHPVPARFHLRINGAGQIDIAKHLEFPRMAPCGLIDLVDRAAGNIAGVVDENIDVGCIFHKLHDIFGLPQIDNVGGGIDLMRRSQAL
jgi:hypothetical protein